MANYTGVMVDEPTESEFRLGYVTGSMETARKKFNNAYVSVHHPYAGTYSLELRVSGIFTVDCGLEAGSRTITMKAWAPVNGSIKVDAVDPDDGTIMDSATTASEDEWEDLSMAFTAEKKVYLLIFYHLGITAFVEGEDTSGYIDNILVT